MASTTVSLVVEATQSDNKPLSADMPPVTSSRSFLIRVRRIRVGSYEANVSNVMVVIEATQSDNKPQSDQQRDGGSHTK
ncbi:hypothetical protein J6590_029906 [Homalodisca vitripennis]|nr:hypothetical protein J6590_029906 [Homalodisca vitripennis]